MALSTTPAGNASDVPFATSVTYNPDQLIAGDLKLVTEGQALITGGADLPRGTVLGKVTLGALTSAAKAGGNTGNGTNTLISAGSRTKTGVYAIRFLTATTYTVTDPQGEALPNGANGAYANPNINFSVTAGGTPFIAGDGFDITVAAGSSAYKKSVATAVDGSEEPCAILVSDALASGGDVNGGAYFTGEFNQRKVQFDPSWSVATLKPLLRRWNIFLKDSVSNSPAT